MEAGPFQQKEAKETGAENAALRFYARFCDMNSTPQFSLSRKNCCGPVMRLVTVFWPAMTTGAGELVLQTTGETRLVVDCKVNPTALVDHLKMIPPGEVPE